MLYKNLFLLWNNKYFLILPLNVISTQPCISGQTVHLPEGGRGGERVTRLCLQQGLKDATVPSL